MALTCHIPQCGFVTAAVDHTAQEELVNHDINAHPALLPCPAKLYKPQALTHLTIDLSVSLVEWADFEARWNRFKIGSNIPERDAATQLLSCITKDLNKVASRTIPDKNSLSVADLLTRHNVFPSIWQKPVCPQLFSSIHMYRSAFHPS